MYSLHAACQQYAWGKIGNESAVADIAKINDPELEIKNDEPYAELWMGAHIKSPSNLLSKDSQKSKSLYEIEKDLPFLLKILSVNKALSIQAHPNKSLAEQLHAERPEIYKDPNHKPEMCIALTEYEGLCGFRLYSQINDFLAKLPHLSSICQTESVNNSDELKSAFANLMSCDKPTIEAKLAKTLEEVSESDKSLLGDLLHRLSRQYPGDVGCFVIYFLNRMLLQPGEAMYLGANVPHAYLDGNCVECMACSDNVVRAGLTPKLIDVDTVRSFNHGPLWNTIIKISLFVEGVDTEISTTCLFLPEAAFLEISAVETTGWGL